MMNVVMMCKKVLFDGWHNAISLVVIFFLWIHIVVRANERFETLQGDDDYVPYF
jgi:hypothetical protein